jgi:hypothetical protein
MGYANSANAKGQTAAHRAQGKRARSDRATALVVFSITVSGDNSPIRVPAQIFSGIGNRGAGPSSRESINEPGPQYRGEIVVLGSGWNFAGARAN